MENLELLKILCIVLSDIEWLIQFVCQISPLRCAPVEMTRIEILHFVQDDVE
jgi:hypothetical protein